MNKTKLVEVVFEVETVVKLGKSKYLVYRMADMPQFKVALVTGASMGIGAAIAKLLATKGMTVILVSRSQEKLEGVLKEIEDGGGKGVVLTCDTSCREQVVEMARKVKEDLGVPDLVVNNAACYTLQEFCDKDYPSWEKMISLNINGYLYIIGEFLPEMKERGSGHVVNISSDSERVAFPGFAVYTGTKFFWAGAAESIRKEISGTGVKITNILPGFVYTEGLDWLLNDEKSISAFRKFGLGEPAEYLAQKDKMLRPEDVAISVWESVNKPANVYVHDVMVKDSLQ